MPVSSDNVRMPIGKSQTLAFPAWAISLSLRLHAGYPPLQILLCVSKSVGCCGSDMVCREEQYQPEKGSLDDSNVYVL